MDNLNIAPPLDAPLFIARTPVTVPFHPQETALFQYLRSLNASSSEEPIKEFVAGMSGVSARHVFLGHRSSAMLQIFLESLKNTIDDSFIVGIPSFCCIAPLRGILEAHCQPFFYEINSSFEISDESLKEILLQKIKVLIIPSFFGLHRQSLSCLATLKTANIVIIRDDVHAFPSLEPQKYCEATDAVMISFHPSKRLPGLGGGALILQKESFIDRFEAMLIRKFSLTTKKDTRLKNGLKGGARIVLKRLEQRSDYVAQMLARRRRHTSAPTDLVTNLVRSLDIPMPPLRMPLPWVRYANAVIPYHVEILGRLNENFEMLRRTIHQVFDPDVFQFIQHVRNPPTHLLLKVSATRRASIGQFLADSGIECSWLYYPLHLLECFSENYDRGMFTHSETVAKQSLLIPLTGAHSTQQIRMLQKTILKIPPEILKN